MDALDHEITRLRSERERLAARLKEIDVELPVLDRAAKLRPVQYVRRNQKTDSTTLTGAVVKSVGGRKKGDISKVWRTILREIYGLQKPQTYQDISDIAKIMGTPVQLTSVRERVRGLISSEYIAGTVESGFTVTENAVRRFGFTKENDRPEGRSDTSGVSAPLHH